MLLDFEGQFYGPLGGFEIDFECVKYLWQSLLRVELDVYNGTDDLDDFSCVTHDL